MRKNVIKFTAIALLSAFALTACDDDIVAKPTGYDDNSPIVTNVGDIYNNNLQDIYDSIRDGNLASDVLDQLLYQYSVSVFGNYNKVTAAKISPKENSKISEGTTLKEAVASAYGDRTVANKFINDHEAFWTKNSDGERVNDNDEVVKGEVAASEQEIARLKEKWETIEKRIAETLYSSISGGAYSERGIFEEKKFLSSLATSIEHKVADPNAADTNLFKGVISPSVEDYEVFTKKTKALSGTDGQDYILHRENYQLKGDYKEVEEANQEITYVEDEIIPSIYRQLLVEQYILDETFNTLGRTSARHISVLSIKKNDNYAQNAKDLMNKFLDNVVFDKNRAYDKDAEGQNLITLDTFKRVSNAWVGTFMSEATYNTTKEYELMNAALGAPQVWHDDTVDPAVDRPYYQGTAYGDMIEELKKINDNPALSENESTYTGGNSYPVSIGREIKTRELETNDYTFTGWYVKSVGVSGLPDSIKNQLFDINVANALTGKDTETCVRYYKDATTGEFKCNLEDNPYKNNPGSLINVVGRIEIDNDRTHDQYFLRNTNRIKGDPFKNDLLFESDGTYYMILVEDAIRSTNLDKQYYGVGEDKNGNEKLPYKVLENYVNEIVEIVADNDTYKSLSKKHWVEKMELKFHDQVVYDYFKSNFPDLFDDDDDSSND